MIRPGELEAPVGLDEENPWPGPSAFDEAAEEFFKGRTEEIDALYRLILERPLSVLFGQSGLGKTSLLLAGLFPRFRQAHFAPVYVRLDVRDRTAPLIEQVENAFRRELEAQGIDAPPMRGGESLWAYLHRTDLELWSSRNYLLTPVLVLDQFEEVFTLGAENPGAIARLRSDLADLVENRLPAEIESAIEQHEHAATDLVLNSQRYKVLLSFREDFLPSIEAWRRDLPSLMRNRMRLLPMSGRQAFQAVHDPAPHLVPDDLAREIVRFVAAQSPDSAETPAPPAGERRPFGAPLSGAPAPGARDLDPAVTNGNLEELTVEPALLSVFCHSLNERRKQRNTASFDRELLADTKEFILKDFYDRALRGMPEHVGYFIQEALITESGYRKPCAVEDADTRYQVTEAELRLLVDRRLLRIEPGRHVNRVELIHDRLADVARDYRDAWREQDARKKLRAQLEATRKRARLLTGLAAAAVALGIMVVLVILAWIAVDRSSVRALSAAAVNSLGRDPERSLLLALQATSSMSNPPEEAIQALTFAFHGSRVRHILPRRRSGPVSYVTFSPDSRHLLTIDREVVLWKMATAMRGSAEGATLPADLPAQHPPFALFSQNGARLAIAAGPRVWVFSQQSDRGQTAWIETHQLDHGAQREIRALALTRDGLRLATASLRMDGDANENELRLWDLSGSAAPLWVSDRSAADRCGAASDPAWLSGAVVFIREETDLLTVDSDGCLRLWNVFSGRFKDTVRLSELRDSGGFLAATLDSAGTRLAVAESTETHVLDLSSRAPRVTRTIPEPATGLAMSGTFLATISDDGEAVYVWDIDTGRRIHALRGHKDRILNMAFSDDGTQLATGSEDGTARVWDITTLGRRRGALRSIAYSAGEALLVTSGDDSVTIWDAITRIELKEARLPGPPVAEAYSADGTKLVTAESPGAVFLWNLANWNAKNWGYETLRDPDPALRPDQAGTAERPSIRSVACGNDAVALGFSDGSVEVLGLRDKSLRLVRVHADPVAPVMGLVFSGDGKTLAVGAEDGRVALIDPTTLERVRSGTPPLPQGVKLTLLAYRRDGRFLGTVSSDGSVRIYRLDRDRSGLEKPLHALRHGIGIAHMAFDPQSGRLATIGKDQTLKVWEPETGTLAWTTRGYGRHLIAVAFHPGKDRVAVATREGIIEHILDLKELQMQAGQRITRPLTADECEEYKVGRGVTVWQFIVSLVTTTRCASQSQP